MKKLIVLLLINYCVFNSSLFAGSRINEKNRLKNDFYLEGGLGYYHNIAAGNQNNIYVQPVPGIVYPPFPYMNKSSGNSVGLYLGGGIDRYYHRFGGGV